MGFELVPLLLRLIQERGLDFGTSTCSAAKDERHIVGVAIGCALMLEYGDRTPVPARRRRITMEPHPEVSLLWANFEVPERACKSPPSIHTIMAVELH